MTEIPDEDLYNQADEIQNRLTKENGIELKTEKLSIKDKNFIKEVMSNVKSKVNN